MNSTCKIRDKCEQAYGGAHCGHFGHIVGYCGTLRAPCRTFWSVGSLPENFDELQVPERWSLPRCLFVELKICAHCAALVDIWS